MIARLALWFCLGFGCLFFASDAGTVEHRHTSNSHTQAKLSERSIYSTSNPQMMKAWHQRGISPQSTRIKQHSTHQLKTFTHSWQQHSSIDKPNETIQGQALSSAQRQLAKQAQAYFTRYRHPNTGLVDAVAGYPHLTLWDIASIISAELAMEALALQSSQQTERHLKALLRTLNTMPLYQDQLPNRQYDAKTGLPSGPYSQTKYQGNGWSALDIGRLLIWLHILEKQKPKFSDEIDQITKHWQLKRAVHQGTLYGMKLSRGKQYYRQEGRLGYLQYAATGFVLFGFNLEQAFSWDHVQTVNIQTLQSGPLTLLIDDRNLPYFTSDPYVLYALEITAKQPWWQQLDAIYTLHQQHYRRHRQIYAFAEDSMDRAPWFAYNNLYYYQQPWLSTSSGGRPIESGQTLSHKVGLTFSVLFDNPFATQLEQQVIVNSQDHHYIPTGQYADGRINRAYNINTQALVLLSLWYQQRGHAILDKAPPHTK